MRYLLIISFLLSIYSCSNSTTSVSIQDDVAFLASDEMEGRQTGTEGEKIALAYISKRFEELGLTGKGTNGYVQPFSFKPKRIRMKK